MQTSLHEVQITKPFFFLITPQNKLKPNSYRIYIYPLFTLINILNLARRNIICALDFAKTLHVSCELRDRIVKVTSSN